MHGLMIDFQFVFGTGVREEKERGSEEEEEEGWRQRRSCVLGCRRREKGRAPKLTFSPSRGKQGYHSAQLKFAQRQKEKNVFLKRCEKHRFLGGLVKSRQQCSCQVLALGGEFFESTEWNILVQPSHPLHSKVVISLFSLLFFWTSQLHSQVLPF